MKQLKSRAMLLSLVVIIFATSTTNMFSQLTKIWENKIGGDYQGLSPNAKLYNSGGYLIDLTNGEVIDHRVNPERIILTYSGDRYFVSNSKAKTMQVYDRYTKEFIQDIEYIDVMEKTITTSNDSTIINFDYTTNSLQFWNVYTHTIEDSFQLPELESSNEYYSFVLNDAPTFSYDGRYYAFVYVLCSINKPFTLFTRFAILDRQADSIVFAKYLSSEHYSRLTSSFMHTSNQLAYGEVVKLEGDDKAYSYLRIFDLDKREIIRNVKVGDAEESIYHIVLRMDDRYILYINSASNFTKIYDYQNDKKLKYEFTIVGPIYIDDSLYVSGTSVGYRIDWNTVGVEDKNPTDNVPILYPNPTTNLINLNVDTKYFQGQWKIINLQGSTMLQGIIPPEPILQINVNLLAPQTYTLIIQKDGFISTFKLIII